jgi:hypothetical protein
MAANWNFCARSCVGEWIGLCSGDDMLLPAYVDSMWEGTRNDPAAVFVMGGWENFDELTGHAEPHYLLSMGRVTHHPKTLRNLLRGPKASFAAFCFRRSAFDIVGGYDERFHLIQDWMFQFDIAKLGSFVKVDKLVARYRITERPSIAEERWLLYTEDRINYLSNKIWKALDYGVTSAQIEEVAKSLLCDILREVRLRHVKLDKPAEASLNHLAVRVGLADQWEKWKIGKWMPPEPKGAKKYLILKMRKWLMHFR